MILLEQWQRDISRQVAESGRAIKVLQQDIKKIPEVHPVQLNLPGLRQTDIGAAGWNNWKFINFSLINFSTSTGLVMFSLSAAIEAKDLAVSLAYRVVHDGINFFDFVATRQQSLMVDNMYPKSSASYISSGEYVGVHNFQPGIDYSINLFYQGKTRSTPTGSESLKISDIDLIVKDLQ